MKLVTKEQFLEKTWLPVGNYGFAAGIQITPVSGAELAECARLFPLAFVEHEERQMLVALFSLLPGKNLFVAPDGRWLARYRPSAFRCYPFRLAKMEGSSLALCVDEESGLVKDSGVGAGGTPFFGEDGSPHPQTQKIAEFLTHTHNGIQHMQKAAALLTELDLLEPWPLKAKEGEVEKTITGISRINEKKMNTLGGDDLVKLREGGALIVAYAQLLSMGNIFLLTKLAELHDQHAKAKVDKNSIPEGSFASDDNGSLKIDWNTFLKE